MHGICSFSTQFVSMERACPRSESTCLFSACTLFSTQRPKSRACAHSGSFFPPKCVSFFRIHLNDIENIVPFLLLGPAYILSSPTLASALWHFRVFTGARIVHFLAYAIPLPMPTRTLAFLVAFFTMLSMAVQVLITAM